MKTHMLIGIITPPDLWVGGKWRSEGRRYIACHLRPM